MARAWRKQNETRNGKVLAISHGKESIGNYCQSGQEGYPLMDIEYRYNEGDLLRQITDYVNATYGQHYSQNKYQATEFIIDGGHGVGFTIGNIMKYAQRYGHKGTPEDWRKDLMKVIHYAIIAMYVHDKNVSDNNLDNN